MAQPDLWTKVLHPDDRDRVLAESERTNSTGEPFDIEYRLIRKDGEVVWVHDHAYLSSHPPGAEPVWNGVLTDITEAKRAEERIAFLAYHDGLTGLPNQALFVQLAELGLARARRGDLALAILSIDIDRFRLANETFGIDAGDRLLVMVAERLSAAMRETD